MPQLLMSELVMLNQKYRAGKPEVSDEVFDAKLEALRRMLPEADYKVFRNSLAENGGDVSHDYVIGSLDKVTFGNDELSKWLFKARPKTIFWATKLDGMSAVRDYVNGVLVECSTKGDGSSGESLLEKANIVGPSIVPVSGIFSVRGEFVMSKDDAVRLKYANARNGVVGAMKSHDIDYEVLNACRFVAYQILGSTETRKEQYESLRKLGFEVPESGEILFLNDTPLGQFVENDLKDILLEQKSESKKYLCDGLVISDPDYVHENVMLPDGMVAFKVNTEFAETPIVDLTVKTSKDGKLKGTCKIEPRMLCGTRVENVNFFDYAHVLNGYCPGSIVIVTKGGDIIPDIHDFVVRAEFTNVMFEKYFKYCPSCGALTVRDGADAKCPNTETCPAQGIKSVTHFLANLNVLGAGESNLEKWNITSINDLVTFVPTDRNGEKFLEELKSKMYTASREKLIGSMNWSGIGESTFEKLLAIYDLNLLLESALKGISINLPSGVGPSSWEKIVAGVERNFRTLSLIITSPHYAPVAPKAAASNALESKSFCITGTLSRKRKDIENDIVNNGGKIAGINKKLDYLVVGTDAGGKLDDAKKLGIKILTENELMEMLNK